MKKRTVATPFGEIAYVEVGDGPPLLMIHGLFAASSTFDELIPLLSSRFRCVAPDLPGNGGSTAEPAFHPGWESYSRFVVAFADAVGLERFFLLGHSMGGGISVMTAAAAPERVERLILVDPVTLPFKAPLKGRLPVVPVLGELLFKLYGEGMFLDYFEKDVFLDGAKMNRDKVKELYRIFAGSKKLALGALRATNDPATPAAAVSSVECPTLAIWGEDDRLVPPALLEPLQALIKGSAGVLIPSCGHSPPEERPEATAQEIERFLASID